ncbi:Uncharacterised protein [Mycobacterium tuberculosis]|nr:Uncharacterised protein [Mycobacterium tuberculosis]
MRQPFRCDADGRVGRQTQNPERGRKRVKPPPASPGPPRSSDPKPREGTETRQQSRRPARMTPVVRPKTPRGDGNMGYLLPARGDAVRGRQTQNPERGRKPGEQRRRQPGGHGSVVRPKTPRGDGNWIALTGLALILVVVRPKTPRGDGNSTSISLTSPGEKITSSDPKPRERTETRRRSRRCRCPNRHVVRPKTPRGDGNLERVTADGTIETCRQTQNPERGRKREEPSHLGLPPSVVRPKTPRGDGNLLPHAWATAFDHVVRPKTPRGDGNLE